ncbi:MAG: AbrB family transcriptional regulator [Rhizobiaceae bacterium]
MRRLRGIVVRIAEILCIYIWGVGIGYLLNSIRFPMPFLLGPLFCTMFWNILYQTGTRIPVATRSASQLLISSAVGLNITLDHLLMLAGFLVPMVIVTLLTVVAGFCAAGILVKLTRIDVVTASLSSVPGGPVEMSSLAQKYGVHPAPVAFAQTLRIMLIVVFIPPLLFSFAGMSGQAGYSAATAGQGGVTDVLLLLAIASVGALTFVKARISTPFFLGPLAFCGVASVASLPIAAPPFWVVAGAQVMMGVWLGSVFDGDTLVKFRTFALAAIVSTMVLIAMCGLVALTVSELWGIPLPTMILASAPGSLTEMVMTAKILNEGVVIVTGFHVIRLFLILPSAPYLFSATARLARRLGTTE